MTRRCRPPADMYGVFWDGPQKNHTYLRVARKKNTYICEGAFKKHCFYRCSFVKNTIFTVQRENQSIEKHLFYNVFGDRRREKKGPKRHEHVYIDRRGCGGIGNQPASSPFFKEGKAQTLKKDLCLINISCTYIKS